MVAVYPPQVTVGDTVNVSLKLNGDGWALYRYPIDVEMVIDRSLSMDWVMSADNQNPGRSQLSRIQIAQGAATDFTKEYEHTK